VSRPYVTRDPGAGRGGDGNTKERTGLGLSGIGKKYHGGGARKPDEEGKSRKAKHSAQ